MSFKTNIIFNDLYITICVISAILNFNLPQ